ncbi:MAG: ribosome biogenesis GTP-binding protein YihA/YsxC [Polyangiales bacterium]
MSTDKIATGGPSPFDVLEAEFLASAAEPNSFPPPARAEIAFAGRSNVGKSSMMNALMQRKGLVRTSSTPGCTRAVNVFHAVTRGGLDLQLVDLPGYGFAKRSKSERIKWGPLLEEYLQRRPTLRAVIVLIDVRRGLEDDDRQLLEFCALDRPGNAPVRTVVVATKLDLLPKSKRKPALEAIAKTAGTRVIGFSADSSDGREDIWKLVDKWVREGFGS